MNSNEKNFCRRPAIKPKPGSVKVVRALCKYTAKNVDELSFDEGDILYIFDRHNPDWWKAHVGPKSGLIPSNCVDYKFDDIVNPLHEAARRGNINFLKECLSQNVSSTELDSMGNTPLYWASHSGHMDCLLCLLKQPNPPINAQNHFGDTPLHGAVAKNNYDVVQILLESGADINLSNKNNEIPLDLASSVQLKNILQKFKSNQMSLNQLYANSKEYLDDSD